MTQKLATQTLVEKKRITKYISILSQIHQPLSVPQGIITDTVGT